MPGRDKDAPLNTQPNGHRSMTYFGDMVFCGCAWRSGSERTELIDNGAGEAFCLEIEMDHHGNLTPIAHEIDCDCRARPVLRVEKPPSNQRPGNNRHDDVLLAEHAPDGLLQQFATDLECKAPCKSHRNRPAPEIRQGMLSLHSLKIANLPAYRDRLSPHPVSQATLRSVGPQRQHLIRSKHDPRIPSSFGFVAVDNRVEAGPV